MKLIDFHVHRYFDYLTVLVFALAPLALPLGGTPAAICWILAIVHLLLTFLTRPSKEGRGSISFILHGFIELAVALALILSPWIFGFAPGSRARIFFMAAGGVIFAAWLLTDYAGRGIDRV